MKLASSLVVRGSGRDALLKVASLLLATLAGCAAPAAMPETRDPGVLRDSAAGHSAFDEGDYSLAADLYRQALARAQGIGDAQEVIAADISVSICLAEAGTDAEIEPYLLQAAYESNRIGSPRAAEVQILRARAAYRLHQLDIAASIAQSVASDTKATARWRGRSQVVLGEIAVDRKDVQAAADRLAGARQLITKPDEVEAADLSGLEGGIAQLHGEPVQAAQAFDREAGAAQRAGQYRRMARAMALSAQAWAQAGHRQESADRYYHAALSAESRGETAAAREWLDHAAASASSPELRRLIQQARRGLTPASAP